MNEQFRSHAFIDSYNQYGLRHIFRLKDIFVNPPSVDLSNVTPVIDMGFGGFNRFPDPDNQIFKAVAVRASSDTDPTINIPTIIPGSTPTAVGEMTYGVGSSLYVWSHHVIINGSDPTILQTSMNQATVTMSCLLYNGTEYTNIYEFSWDGINDLCVNYDAGPPIWCERVYFRIPLPPFILPDGWSVRIGINTCVHQVSNWPLISLEGLSVQHYIHALKVPRGSPFPSQRYR